MDTDRGSLLGLRSAAHPTAAAIRGLTLTQRQSRTLSSPVTERNEDAMISTTSIPSWTGMVPVDDTALAVTDSGGFGMPVIYLNGQFATQGYWRRVIAELGPD